MAITHGSSFWKARFERVFAKYLHMQNTPNNIRNDLTAHDAKEKRRHHKSPQRMAHRVAVLKTCPPSQKWNPRGLNVSHPNTVWVLAGVKPNQSPKHEKRPSGLCDPSRSRPPGWVLSWSPGTRSCFVGILLPQPSVKKSHMKL